MKTVGVRELKNRLSEYLRQVRSGESVLVTDRGEVVAEFSPPGHGLTDASIPAGLLALARRGLATLGSPGDASLYKALPRRHRGKHSAAQLLDEERGSR
jgi:antitoxin (DNA-binding transcriptional repressor) of toxin-antitoxin stability system